MIQQGITNQQYKERIETEVGNLNQMRPFPTTAGKLMEICKQPNANVKEIIQLIECDPSIATKVLSLSNSPLYGVSRPIGTIGHAVVILGFQTVSKVAISIAAGQIFDQGSAETENYRRKVFSRSIGCATAGKIFARHQSDGSSDESFLIGIMQDIGQLIFLDTMPAEYLAIAEHNDLGLTDIENNIFGIDHATVGQMCGTSWGLPAPINLAILEHHHHWNEVTLGLSRTAIIGGYFARKWQLGFDEQALDKIDPALEEAATRDPLSELEAESREVFAAINDICAI